MTLSPEALEAVTAKGFLHPSGRIRRGDIADKLAERLREHHVVQSTDDVHMRERAATLQELTVAIFGADNEELRYLVSQLTAPGHDGAVQRKLNNGYVLCAARVPRVVGDVDGQPIMSKFVCRFVADSPEVLKTYLLDPVLERTDRYVSNITALVRMAVERVPALQPAAQQWAAELGGHVQAKLTAPPSTQ